MVFLAERLHTMKLSDALIGYWLDREIELSERTIQKYKDVFQRFVEFIGNPEIETLPTLGA